MKEMKRFLSMMLVLALLVGMMPLQVLAEETEPAEQTQETTEETTEETAEETSEETTGEESVSVLDDVDALADDGNTTEKQPFASSTAGSANFRIPALITLSNGSLLSAADARWGTTADGQGLDTIVSLSQNNGETWSYSLVNYFDDSSAAHTSAAAYIDPVLVEDKGTVYLFCDILPRGNTIASIRQGSGFVQVDGTYYLALYASEAANATDTPTYYAANVLNDDGYYPVYHYGDKTQTNYYLNPEYDIYQYGDSKYTAVTATPVDMGTATGSISANVFYSAATNPGIAMYAMSTEYLCLRKGTLNQDGTITWGNLQLLNGQVKIDNGNNTFYGVGPGRGLVTGNGHVICPCYTYPTERTSFIYSTDNGYTWKRTADATTIHSSEAQLVELSDGTIRAFFRSNETGCVSYVDAVWDSTNQVYTWGDTNTNGPSNCSSCQISAITYSMPIDGKEAILVSCPVVSDRYNGKIFVGLVNEDKTMDWKYTYEVNGSSDRFQYSCMTELSDGSVGLLYENGVASVYYDVFTMDQLADNAALGTGIYVSANGEDYLSAVTMATGKTLELDVVGAASEDTITLENNDETVVTAQYADGKLTLTGNTTGTATVTLTKTPVSRATVIGESTQITVTVEDASTKEVSIYVGDTVEIVDWTGYYQFYTGGSPAVAEVTLEGSTDGFEQILASEYDELPEGEYYIEAAQKANSYTVDTMLSNEVSDVSTYLALKGSKSALENATVWTLTRTANGLTLSADGKYLDLAYEGKAYATENEKYVEFENLTNTTTYTGLKKDYPNQWLVFATSNGTVYALNQWMGGGNSYAAGTNQWRLGNGNAWNFYHLAPYTQLQIKGLAEGTSQVTIGSVTYNITVKPLEYVTAASALYEQIQIAGMYYSGDYTTVSWSNLEDALEEAHTALEGHGPHDDEEAYGIAQKAIDDAVDGLKAAIEGLSANSEDKSFMIYEGGTKTFQDTSGKYDAPAATTHLKPMVTHKTQYSIAKVEPGYVAENDSYYMLRGSQMLALGAENIEWPTDAQWADTWKLEAAGDGGFYLMQNGQYLNWSCANGAISSAYLVATSADATVTYFDRNQQRFENSAGEELAAPAQRGEKTITNITIQGILETDSSGDTVVIGEKTYNGIVYANEKVINLTVGESVEISLKEISDAEIPKSNDYYTVQVLTDPYSGERTMRLTGKTVGEPAKFKMGSTWYMVTIGDAVTPEKVEEITMYVGEVFAANDVTIGYFATPTSNSAETVAVPTLTYGVSEPEKVTSIVSGQQYYIACYSTNNLLTDTPDGSYFSLSGSPSNPPANALWKFTAGSADGTYKISRGGYLLNLDNHSANLDGTDAIAVKISDVENTAWLIQDGSYYMNQIGGRSATIAGGYTGDGDSAGNWWYLYNPGNPITKVRFKALAVGNTEIVVGDTTYKITVKESSYGTTAADATAVVSGTGSHNGAVATRLNVTQGAVYTLKISETLLGQSPSSVKWEIQNEEIAEINESSGSITAIRVGTTTAKATVTLEDDTTVTYYVEVEVWPGPESSSTRLIDVRIENINHSNVYCSLNVETQLHQLQAGEILYFYSDIAQYMALNFFAGPESESYALDFMSATNSSGDFDSIVADDPQNTDFRKRSGGAGNTTANWFGNDAFDAMIRAAWALESHGAQGFTRGAGNSYGVSTTLTFNSDPLPTVEKTLSGVLPATLKRADFRRYSGTPLDAYAGEYVYFQIRVTQPRPTAFKMRNGTYDLDADGKLQALLEYSNALLVDDMEDDTVNSIERTAYFYVQEYDTNQNGVVDGDDDPVDVDGDGNPDDLTQVTQQDIKDKLNSGWDPNSTEDRYFDFFVVYKIQGADAGEQLKNSVQMTIRCEAIYSKTSTENSSNTVAAMSIDRAVLKPILIDFGLPVSKVFDEETAEEYGLTDLSFNSDSKIEVKTTYGTAVLEKEETEYTLTYTPKSVLQGVDSVIFKTGDKSAGFNVYPATTVYYEETFAAYANTDGSDGTWTVPAAAIKHQQYQVADEAATASDDPATIYQFGYDGAYASDSAGSNNTEALSKGFGDTATIEFVGTGIEIYANCTDKSGRVAVMIYKSGEAYPHQFYIVDTHTGKGDTAATDFQGGENYGLPIVSVRDLDPGKYVVVLQHILSAGETAEAVHDLKIDGFRIHNTIKDLASPAYPDSEKNPVFVEVRDYVLGGLEVVPSDNGYNYIGQDDFIDQVYEEVGDTKGVVVLFDSSGNDVEGSETTNGISFREDLLNNGPKNEIFLEEGMSVVFELVGGVKAQIGLKAINGAVTYDLTNGGTYSSGTVAQGNTTSDNSLSSSTDMFYHTLSGAVVIKNTGSNVMSVTLIKAFGAADGSGVLKPITRSAMVAQTDSFGDIFVPITTNTLAFAVRALNGEFVSKEETDPSNPTDPSEEPEPSESTQPSEEPEPSESTQPTDPTEPEEIENPFTDVPEGEYYHPPVLWAVSRGITTGTSATTFSPADECTRAQVVTFLWRSAGEPEPVGADNPFKDVEQGQYYYKAVLWAVEKGITTGMDAKTFGTNLPCNRAQVVTFLWRTAGEPEPVNRENPFTDVKPDCYYYSAVLWAVERGITTGMTPTAFQPDTTCNRAQIVTFLYRYMVK